MQAYSTGCANMRCPRWPVRGEWLRKTVRPMAASMDLQEDMILCPMLTGESGLRLRPSSTFGG